MIIMLSRASKFDHLIFTNWNLSMFAFELALKELNVDAADVTHVVCTHGHSDHTGCNYLFLHAKQHIVGHSISHKHNYKVLGIGEHAIDADIYVLATPGHTMDSVSVIVANSNMSANKVAICGDLFERHEDCFDKNIWLDAGSESASVQLKQRLAIAEMVDIIVPGHGPPFTVTQEIRDALKQCTLD